MESLLRRGTPLTWWQRFWFREAPPHLFALLRILFGLIGCLSTLALRDVGMFWDPEGLVAGRASTVVQGALAGRALFLASLGSFVAMTLGYRSGVSVAAAFIASIAQSSWNWLPLSAAHEVHRAGLFALMWADCGAVWSIDAWRTRRSAPPATLQVPLRQPLWPLRLIQIQLAVIYATSALWKLSSASWRHGEALHFVLNNNVFRRIPHGLPDGLEPLAMVTTYVVLAWELAFAPMLLFKWSRRFALGLGVALHLGMWASLELGPFSAVMLASYCAFLDPNAFAARVERKTKRATPRRVLA